MFHFHHSMHTKLDKYNVQFCEIKLFLHPNGDEEIHYFTFNKRTDLLVRANTCIISSVKASKDVCVSFHVLLCVRKPLRQFNSPPGLSVMWFGSEQQMISHGEFVCGIKRKMSDPWVFVFESFVRILRARLFTLQKMSESHLRNSSLHPRVMFWRGGNTSRKRHQI